MSELLQFDTRSLRDVETRTSQKPVVVDRSLPSELIAHVKNFPATQLNHVVPKVSTRPVTDSAPRGLLKEIASFDTDSLKDVHTVVKTAPLVLASPPAAKPAALAADAAP